MMQKFRAAPVLRSPQSQMQDLRRKAAYLEATVAVALVLSICTLILALADGPVVVAWKMSALA
jgi:hypothetical protein